MEPANIDDSMDDVAALDMDEVAENGRGRPAAASVTDDLLECLMLLARVHGAALTRDAALAGLPLPDGHLMPSLFARAAQRAGLSSKSVRAPLGKLNTALFPVVLLLPNSRACLLLGWARNSKGEKLARVVFPELGQVATIVSVEKLASRYTGHAIYARPNFRFDARAPIVKPTKHGHWFWGVIAENRSLYREVLLAALLINLFALGMPFFIMNVYDRVVPNNAIETLWVLAIGIIVVIFGDFTLRVLRGRFVDLASSRADVKLSAYIMERVLGMRMEKRPESAGSFAANLRAFESVRDFIGSATVAAFVDMPFALLFLIVIGWVAWPLMLPLIVAIAILLLYALVVQSRMHELAETTYRAGAQRNATLIEGLVGIETLKALSAEGTVQHKWENSAAFLAQMGTHLRFLSATSTNAASLLQQLASVAIIIIGVYQVGAGTMTTGAMIACFMLSGRAMAPISQVSGMLVQYHVAATSLESLDRLMENEVERPHDKTFISRGGFAGAIEFRDVSFSYPGQQTASLRNVSFSIRPGERVGILGKVGSGKTTLEKLILGLYRPASGSVLVDGIDVRQLDPAELRRNIGYVQQDVMLFYGTLRENITMGAPFADDSAVLRAAQIGEIVDFVNTHPKGFDMPVGERGESLSGGQRQGVAIARAVINEAPMLLLDEPTSSMDNATESQIKMHLGEYAKDKTLILVTHRTSLLELVDRVIVMDGGRVVADGPKSQVVQALRQGRIGKAD